ncbi:MAG: TIGR01212 family radical SAM protein [Erysipelotrichaceae bacterium]|nr:TIGR01212 family radical SAM protein [Erysipelotrichaceae bacterium]
MYMFNPFQYSDDNKRYYTWNYYLKKRYGQKVCKVPLDAHFTCPNRDGTKGSGGCLYCSARGSGDFAASFPNLNEQFEAGREMMHRKWPGSLLIAYFQAYSNTYASIEYLKKVYEPFIERDDIVAIAIATRGDCINEKTAELLSSWNQKKEIWVELGLQSIHDKSEKYMNRCHTVKEFEDALYLLHSKGIKCSAHIINSLPYESKEDMIETAKYIATLPLTAVKIHMLHLMEDTVLGEMYKNEPFSLLTREEYVDVVVSQLEVLPPTMIIQRLTGDAPLDLLIEPRWTIKKTIVLNEIDKEMVRRDTYQGKYYMKTK